MINILKIYNEQMTSFIEKKMEIKLEELYPVDISCGKYITYVLCKNDDRLFMVGIFSNEFSRNYFFR